MKQRVNKPSKGSQVVHRPTPLETPCRLYRGPRNHGGYGRRPTPDERRKGGRAYQLLHRWVVEQATGRTLEPSEIVMHRCDNPPCFRYDHLVIGTRTDNGHDRDAKGRTIVPYFAGEDHSLAKLTDQQVLQIRDLLERGTMIQKDIAAMFGVSGPTISRIKMRQTRAHLLGQFGEVS